MCYFSIGNWHIVEVETWGPGDIESGAAFHAHTIRRNPAQVGKVTGTATYASFLSSLLCKCICNVKVLACYMLQGVLFKCLLTYFEVI